MAYARKRDANQSSITRDLYRLGFHIVDLSRVGHGVPDMVVTGYNRHTCEMAALWVEVKTDSGNLTLDETLWRNEYPDDGPYIVARSTEDVLRWFGAG